MRGAWAARERLLVAVGPDAQAERLVRAGKRIADRPRCRVAGGVRRDAGPAAAVRGTSAIGASRSCGWPTSLGAEAITLGGSSAGAELLEYARTRNVTRIAGRQAQPRALAAPVSPLDHRSAAVERSRDIDVLVIGASDAARAPAARRGATTARVTAAGSDKHRWPRYLLAVAATLAATALCWFFYALLSAARPGQPGHDLPAEQRAGGGLRRPARGAS